MAVFARDSLNCHIQSEFLGESQTTPTGLLVTLVSKQLSISLAIRFFFSDLPLLYYSCFCEQPTWWQHFVLICFAKQINNC